MMNCTEFDLARSLPRLRQRFPGLVVDQILSAQTQADDLIRALAASQGI